jgi:transcriptional regulator with XRE-family HTH domain
VDVAEKAGVSEATVSAVEHGQFESTSLRIVRGVAAAAGVSLSVTPRWRGPDLYRLLDEKHAAIAGCVVTRLTALGWAAKPEHTFSIYGERGSIDVLAWLPSRRAALVVEVKTQLVDLQDLLSTLDRKRRLAVVVAQGLGWRPEVVGTLLVMPAETQARNSVVKHRALLDGSYPARGAEVQDWLRTPQRDLGGIWFLNFTVREAKRRPGGSFRVRRARGVPEQVDPRSETDRPAVRPPYESGSERPMRT